jgi:hypothetical protein
VIVGLYLVKAGLYLTSPYSYLQRGGVIMRLHVDVAPAARQPRYNGVEKARYLGLEVNKVFEITIAMNVWIASSYDARSDVRYAWWQCPQPSGLLCIIGRLPSLSQPFVHKPAPAKQSF